MMNLNKKAQLLLKSYLSLTVSLIVVWSFSFLIVSIEHYVISPWLSWLGGVVNQLLFSSIAILFIVPFLFLIKSRWFTTLSSILFGVIVLFEMISVFYFNITLTPIDKTIFQFDLSQMEMIAGDFVVFKWYYLLLILPPFIYFYVNRFFDNSQKEKKLLLLIPLSWIVMAFTGVQISTTQTLYKKLNKNKTYLFLHSTTEENPINKISVSGAVEIYQKNEDKNFTSQTYPLLHTPSKKNPLKPFFQLKKESPPNIVFIVVESLSSSFSGINADEVSYTPFLDSLSRHSLYFENALATGERTFAVLPSLLGSLPHGKKGFTHERNGYPETNTFISWLKQNSYSTRFFYGGNSRFDYMDLFLNDQGIDNIIDQGNYKKDGLVKQEGVAAEPFGISDNELFNQVFQSQRKDNVSPYFDIVLTLSMHYPFIIEKPEKYLQEVKTILAKSDAPAELKSKHKKYLKALSTFTYTDDVLKEYFQKRKSSDDHQNTIYVILGDHMMTDIPQTSYIEKYRIPIMIYSPLLKRSKRIKAVNTQLDLAPSFYQLLNNSYNFKSSADAVHWLGTEVDTLSTFRNKRTILFMRNNRVCDEFLCDSFFISGSNSYMISPRLKLEEEPQSKLISEIYQAYQKIHTYTVDFNKISPLSSGDIVYLDENIELLIDESTEYSNIAKHILEKDLNSIYISAELLLKNGWKKTNKDDDESQPILVAAINRDDKNLIWERVDLELSSQSISSKRSIELPFKENLHFDLKKGDQVSFYFWNKELKERPYEVVVQKIKISGLE